ncbi:uncharacterized protein EV420DRAFT_923107 [Desarmillaria tabescens]|uniref:Uncharacterized protein n=1 Tax=Armillaria tabescens TaxID=1929756 RepID=A0AA39MTJ2_ARMTA|nr:uncharacterized protein EV420DRAFT_923107 [Desarmillaria tabescens]KAK0445683.1 hypothetical protein EV420DRAFT_923107 [Desarmillaria tabescens]
MLDVISLPLYSSSCWAFGFFTLFKVSSTVFCMQLDTYPVFPWFDSAKVLFQGTKTRNFFVFFLFEIRRVKSVILRRKTSKHSHASTNSGSAWKLEPREVTTSLKLHSALSTTQAKQR